MTTNFHKRVLVSLFIFLLCLCAVPAFSRAAQEPLPEPTDSLTVEPTLDVSHLKSYLQLPAEYTLTVLKPDGSIRSEGFLQNDDLAVLKAPSGETVICYKIAVEGSLPSSSSPSTSSTPDVSSEPGTSSAPDVSSNPHVSSSPNVSSEPSPPPNPSPSSISSRPLEKLVLPGAAEKNGFSVFARSIRVETLAEQLQKEDSCSVTDISADGTERKSGLVCTGDCLTVGSGDFAYTFHAVILGDLTQCGHATERGCSMFYDDLTGNQALSPELALAADMDLDGKLNTADLLEMKKQSSGNAPEQSPNSVE